MKHYTQTEYLARGEELFGEDLKNWKWVCPACGRVNTGSEFAELDVSPDLACRNCIGRFNGNMKPPNPKNNKNGCDWTAGGLFRLDGVCKVTMDDGYITHAFSFYGDTETEGDTNGK